MAIGNGRAKMRPNSASASPYSRWAPIYDLIFDLPFHPGRLAAAGAAAEAAGEDGEVLVVGVGTGLELGLLPKKPAHYRHRSERAHAENRPRTGRQRRARSGQGAAHHGRRRARISGQRDSTSRSRPM